MEDRRTQEKTESPEPGWRRRKCWLCAVLPLTSRCVNNRIRAPLPPPHAACLSQAEAVAGVLLAAADKLTAGLLHRFATQWPPPSAGG